MMHFPFLGPASEKNSGIFRKGKLVNHNKKKLKYFSFLHFLVHGWQTKQEEFTCKKIWIYFNSSVP